jgi:raffinose/stachyose/melibiose transport system permease protein
MVKQFTPPRTARKTIVTIMLTVLAVGIMYPFIWTIINSLKSGQDFALNTLGWPERFVWRNYRDAWIDANIGLFTWNSIVVAVPTVIMVLVLSILAAYAFAYREFRAKMILYVYVVAGFAIPFEVVIIPLFLQMRDLGLLNTYWAVILPQIAIMLPFGVLIMRSFMLNVDKAIIDAARIDGCGSLRLLVSVVIPCIIPAVTSLIIFTFMWTWNSLFLPMVMITKNQLRTIPLGLTYFSGQYGMNIPLLSAAAVMACLPVVIVYLIFQGEFIRGITAGAVKA